MTHFCTLFDSGYLTRGLALYESLLGTGEPFQFYLYCFDDLAYELLLKLDLRDVTLIRLADFETPALLSVKSSRTRGEYCWTCTSHIIADAIARFGLEQVTYLDADLYFFSRPSLLLEEMRQARASTMLTEHRYHPDCDQSATSGTYCVQFMPFRSDARGMAALEWWQARCIEWCFNRMEDGKFGDQKYLDDWPTRFEGVHVLRHIGGGVAPWNVRNYVVGEGPTVDGEQLVFYHFHALKWFTDGHFELADGYKLPPGAHEYIYLPYLAALKRALEKVRSVQFGFDRGKAVRPPGLRARLRHLKRKAIGKAHVVPE